MEEIIEKIYNEVKEICMKPSNAYGIGAWDHHIKLVYEIAVKKLVLAALLHDIASVTNKDYTENHHIIGSKIAEEMLEKYNLDSNVLIKITNCILNHRGSVLKDKILPEEICIADSDAMAHFYSVPSLLSMVYKEKNMSIDDGAKFVLDKLCRSYNKLSDMGKNIVDNQYNASKVLLKKY